MAIYLKYGKGPDIKGNVTAEGFKDWVELKSAEFAIDRQVSIKRGGGAAKRHRSMPMISNIICTKSLDSATSGFMNAALGTIAEAAVEIHCCKSGEKGKPEAYLIIKLENVLCTDFGVGGNNDLGESFSLNWAKIEIEYKGYDEKGGVKPARVQYDVTTATAQ